MKKVINAVSDEDCVVDVRRTMLSLPDFMQPFLTWQTGKPNRGQKPLMYRSNLSHIFTAYFALIIGVIISIYSYYFVYYWGLPVGWLLTVSGARKLIPTINHYCVHNDFLPEKWRKKYGWLHSYIADLNSGILFLQDFASYRIEHLTHHGINIVASIVDPDMAFMWQLGFKAGMTKTKLWMVYISNLLNPFSKLHRLFLVSRVKTTFCKATPFRVLVQTLIALVVFLIGYNTSLSTVLVAIIFPMTYLYHMASLMQFSSEHLWLSDVKEDGLLPKESHNFLVDRAKRLTNGRFCGEATPSTANRSYFVAVLLWVKWIFRMLLIHLPIRLFVLPGNLCQHDHHHRSKFGSDWANSIYSREAMAREFRNSGEPLTEVWGLYNAIDMVFDNLSKMKPINPELVENDNDAVLGM